MDHSLRQIYINVELSDANKIKEIEVGLSFAINLFAIVHGLTPELVPPYPVKPGFSECLCLHNAYYIACHDKCQTTAKIGKLKMHKSSILTNLSNVVKISKKFYKYRKQAGEF